MKLSHKIILVAGSLLAFATPAAIADTSYDHGPSVVYSFDTPAYDHLKVTDGLASHPVKFHGRKFHGKKFHGHQRFNGRRSFHNRRGFHGNRFHSRRGFHSKGFHGGRSFHQKGFRHRGGFKRY